MFTSTPDGLPAAPRAIACSTCFVVGATTDACGYEVAKTVLGHAVGGTVGRSSARSGLLDRRRPVMEAWARFVTGAQAADVVPIRSPRCEDTPGRRPQSGTGLPTLCPQ